MDRPFVGTGASNDGIRRALTTTITDTRRCAAGSTAAANTTGISAGAGATDVATSTATAISTRTATIAVTSAEGSHYHNFTHPRRGGR